MVTGRVSHKRRRSWLELGVAGCSLLASPAQAAWPFGTVWTSYPSIAAESAEEARHHHHGTAAAASAAAALLLLRGSRSYSPPILSDAAVPSSPAARQDGLRTLPLPVQRRRLGDDTKEDATFQVALGEWSVCSSACTRTRPVLCETLKFKIVADDLCGEDLPESESACETDACSAAAAVAGGDDTREAGEEETSTNPHNNNANSGSPAGVSNTKGGVIREDVSAHQGSSSEADSSGTPTGDSGVHEGTDKRGVKKAPPGSNGSRSIPGAAPRGSEKGSSFSTKQGSNGGGGGGGGGSKGSPEVEAGVKEGGGGVIGGGEGREDVSSQDDSERRQKTEQGGGADTPDSAPRRQEQTQDKTATSDRKSNLAVGPSSNPQDIDRIGSNPRVGREEYRFWTVLAIGAGAVGSFMAVVVFAVGQYRKEQHRLRGIMALNDFPQDNYINPFARQVMADDDRDTFNL